MSAPALPKGHDEFEALAVAWAIDALEPADQEEFEAHRDGCDVCASAVLTALQVATELAYGVPDMEPPAFLRERVLAAAAPQPPVPGISPEGSSGQDAARRDAYQADMYRVNTGDAGQSGDSPDRGAVGDDFRDFGASDRKVGRGDDRSRALGQDDARTRDAGPKAAGPRDIGQRDTGQRDARTRDVGGQDSEGRDGQHWDVRNLDGGEPGVETRALGRRGGAKGAHRAAAGRRATGGWGGGPRSWGQRRTGGDPAGPGVGIQGSAGAGPAGRPTDRGRAVRGRRRALSVLAAAALVGLSAVTTWQVTRPAPAIAPVIAADRVAALSTQAGERTLATVVVRGERANVVTDGLAPNAGRNTQYVLWGVPDGESGMPTVVGTFEVTAEGLQSYPVRLTQSLDGYPVLAVSEEPAGSPPTSPSRVLARGALGR